MPVLYVALNVEGAKGMLDRFFQADSQRVVGTPGVDVGLGSICGVREKTHAYELLYGDNVSAIEFSR